MIAKKPLALIAGPTASGKSDLGVRLAQLLRERGQAAAIINADSAQVYRDLAVLSARPTGGEMGDIPHHLFGSWDGATACSAADWAKAARRVIADCHRDTILPILVGGTGLYIRTLLDGIAPIPPIDPQVRADVRALPVAEAYIALTCEDAASAQRLAPADSQRIARALEVVRSTGRPLGYWHARMEGGIAADVALHPAVLAPPRDWLNARCDARFAGMFRGGAVPEVTRLLARGLSAELPVMRAIGVPQIAAWLAGTITQEEAIAQAQLATRQYAKRQYTWLRNQLPGAWPRLDPAADDGMQQVARAMGFDTAP